MRQMTVMKAKKMTLARKEAIHRTKKLSQAAKITKHSKTQIMEADNHLKVPLET
jgi:hypothetical protein